MVVRLIALLVVFFISTSALNWNNSGERVDSIEKRVIVLESRVDSLHNILSKKGWPNVR